MCVKCLTPNKPPAPYQQGEGCHVKVIVTYFLAESWCKKITVSEVLGQFGEGEREKRKPGG